MLRGHPHSNPNSSRRAALVQRQDGEQFHAALAIRVLMHGGGEALEENRNSDKEPDYTLNCTTRRRWIA